MKQIFISVVALFTLLSSTNTTSAQSAADSVQKAVITVRNLHCNGDMPTIKKRLLNQDGIDEVSFTERDGDLSTFTILFHSSATNPAQIEKAIESTPGCDDQSETPYRVKRDKKKKS